MASACDDRVFAYAIDASDRIVACNDDWEAFARENGGAGISRPRVLHHSLWQFIGDEETRQLYRIILSRVRSGRTIAVELRCDSPACRRQIELRIARQPDDQVLFDSRIIRQEERDYVALLDDGVPRSAEVVSICSWCKRVQVPGHGWREVEDAVALLDLQDASELPQLAHICCYDCYRRILDRI